MLGGSLYKRIVKRNCYGEYTAMKLMKRLLKGVSYIHSLGFVHRDLKPENILLES
jgi:serine/threonine protein kinase